MTTLSSIGSADLAQILCKTRDAAAGDLNGLSTEEALVAALVLNQPEWLIEMQYTIAEALERIGPDWARLIPAAAKQFEQERETAEHEAARKGDEARVAQFTARPDAENGVIEFSASFVGASSAPGYRDVYLTFNLVRTGDVSSPTIRTTLNIRPGDGETIVREITDVHRFAWRKGAPGDAQAGEQRPTWIDGPVQSQSPPP